MLDVHPPHAPTHTWKDFFIHIATIVVGLLIAVALEQTVEAVHRHHQRADLREGLSHEIDQVLKNCADTEDRKLYHVDWLNRRIEQVKAAVWDHAPLPLAEPFRYPHGSYDFADDPVWRAAKNYQS